MKLHSLASSLVLAGLLALSTHAAHAAAAAQLTQLSGFAMAVKTGGGLRLLSSQSVLEAGDTLVTEPGTWARVMLPGGAQAVVGPQTRLVLTAENKLELMQGQIQVFGTASPLTIEAGGTMVRSGAASFTLNYLPDTAAAVAQRAYARASMAVLSHTVRSDAATSTPLWEPVAQIGAPAQPRPGGPAPGLYVSVIDGMISVSNPSGSSNFAAGQFGYTASVQKPPAVMPTNPGLQFSPPPSFSSVSAPTPGSSGAPKSSSVDCEVR